MLCLGVLGGRAASFEDRVAALFRTPMGEMMALSPDGQRIAYTQQRGADLSIVIMSVEHLGPRRTIKVEPERETETAAAERPPTRLRFLRWATPERLVFAPTERVIPLPPLTDQTGRSIPNPDGPTIVSPIMMTDVEGKERGIVVDARQFMETPEAARKTLADLLRTPKELASNRNEPVGWRMPHLDILGFFPRDREQLIIGTRGAYSVPMQHLVDLRTGSVREFGAEWPAPPGEPQVFDYFRLKVVGERKDAMRPTTAWRDDDLVRVQRELEAKFPRRAVELLDWSDTRARVLFRVTGGSDPGRVFVYQRTEDMVLEILRRAPWLTSARLNDTRFFQCDAPDGARVSGYFTWPKKPRLTPTPLLVILPSGFPGCAQPSFDPEAEVFADLGFAVARLNHRCVGGIRKEDEAAVRTAVDRVSLDDVRIALDWLAARNPERPFDRKRVAALGRGFGGYLAVRGLQLQPGLFHCGIALDAPMELRPESHLGLSDQNGVDWKKLSVLGEAEALKKPVLLLVQPRRNALVDASTTELRTRLQALGRTIEQTELSAEFAAAKPAARASVYKKIEEFLNVHLNQFDVKIGPAKEVE